MSILNIYADISLALETRKGSKIKNFHCRKLPEDGDILRVRAFRTSFPDAIHRPSDPSPGYNCHGLTFGSRRTGINEPSDVRRILTDDGYRVLKSEDKIFPGDIAIYVQDGEISHSGIVVWLQNETPLILSKWGRYHEAIHKPMDCPYNESTVGYYRLDR